MKKTLLLALFCLASTLPALAAPPITAQDVWVREAPPGAPMLAGYLTLNNPSSEDRALVGAQSPAFAMVELHRTVLEDGMARMVAQDAIPVPAGGRTELKPGDYHLMLMKPSTPLKAGDTVNFLLRFDDGSELEVQATVRRAAMGDEMNRDMDHGHSHGAHGDHNH